MRILGHSAAALLIASIVLGGTATAATAQTTTIKDKASDVIAFDDSDPGSSGTVLGYSDSIASGADLRSMKVKHTKKSVAVTLKFADLAADTSVTVLFKVDGRSKAQFNLGTVNRRKAEIANTRGKKKCSVPLTTKTGPGGTIRAVIKRSCLGDPKKVKAAAGAFSYESRDDAFGVKVDIVSAKNIRTETYTKWLKAT